MATNLVLVIQADRDAVQAFHREMGRRLMSDIKTGTSLLDAKGEDSDPIYQAFAAHRIATEARLSTDAEVLRRALEPFALIADTFRQQPDGVATVQMEWKHFRAAREAIAALSPTIDSVDRPAGGEAQS